MGTVRLTCCIVQEACKMEDYETLDMYQQSLGELLLALAGKNLTFCNSQWGSPENWLILSPAHAWLRLLFEKPESSSYHKRLFWRSERFQVQADRRYLNEWKGWFHWSIWLLHSIDNIDQASIKVSRCSHDSTYLEILKISHLMCMHSIFATIQSYFKCTWNISLCAYPAVLEILNECYVSAWCNTNINSRGNISPCDAVSSTD